MARRAEAINTCIDILMGMPEVVDASHQYYEDNNKTRLADAVYKAAHKQWSFLTSTRTPVWKIEFYETVIRECLAIIRFRTWLSKRNMKQK